MPVLKVRDTSNNLIIDTDYISYGLIASGNLVYRETWLGKYKRYVNTDPNVESSWEDFSGYSDDILVFTANGCIAPVIYVVGQAFLEGVERSGSTFTWLFSGSSTGVKIYVFDHMREAGNGPVLLFRTPAGVVTFNSRQAPLNVLGAVIAPGIPGNAPESNTAKGPLSPYNGGTTSTSGGETVYHAMSYVDVSTGISEEIAVNIAFTRAAQVWPGSGVSNYGPRSVSEYAFGVGGNVRFAFRTVAAAYLNNLTYSGVVYTQFSAVPTILPSASYIRTAQLQFPFQL